MQDAIKMLDVVALTADLPEFSLSRGQVGTVVEQLGQGHVEVEFVDNDGRTYAVATLPVNQLLPLRHAPVRAA